MDTHQPIASRTISDDLARLERIIAAIRVINKHHNLGDATYAVRDHAAGLMHANDNQNSWKHPFVLEYARAVEQLKNDAVISEEQERDRSKPFTILLQGGPKHAEFITLQPNTREYEILGQRKSAKGDGSKVAVVEGKYVETPDPRIFSWRAEQ